MSTPTFATPDNLAQATKEIIQHGDQRWGGSATTPEVQDIADDAVHTLKQHLDTLLNGTLTPTFPEDQYLNENSRAMTAQAAAAIKSYINDDSFTITVIGDTHFPPSDPINDDYRTDISASWRVKGAFAMATKAARILNADAILHVGDMTTGALNAHTGEFNIHNVILGLTEIAHGANIPFLHTLGNHDTNTSGTHGLLHVWQRWWYENLYSKIPHAATVQDKGYYYLDFPQKKIRVISLNWGGDAKNEVQNWWYNDDGQHIGYSGEQLRWLGDVALNLSDKGNDAKNWNVVILSHCACPYSEKTKNMRQIQDLLEAWQTKQPIDIGIGAGYEGKYGPFNAANGFPDQDIIDLWAYSYTNDFSHRAGGTIYAVVQGHDHADWSIIPNKGKMNNTPYRKYQMTSTMPHVPVISVASGRMFENGYAVIISFDRQNDIITIRGICDPNDTRRRGVGTTKIPLALDDEALFFVNHGSIIPMRQQAILHYVAKVESPVADPPPGAVAINTAVTLTTETPDATIHYTTDDSAPSTDSTAYSAPIILSEAGQSTLRAVAAKEGWRTSGEATFVYEVVESEQLRLTVDTGTSAEFHIPTSNAFAFDWAIDWGDGSTGTVSGNGVNGSNGIAHTYPSPGPYTITIKPNGSLNCWLSAFGFASTTVGASVQSNKDKVIAVGGKITPSMVAGESDIALGQVGNGVCENWFYRCPNLTMDTDFGFSEEWDTITAVGNNFCMSMLYSCSGASFTMNDVFNLPQNIQTCGNNFCRQMFGYCSGASFAMNDVFNLPQALITCGIEFCRSLFVGCMGASFTMNDVFNLPQALITCGDNFCNAMFSECRGSSFTMNAIFNTPPQLSASTRTGFYSSMFFNCRGTGFHVNGVFAFPVVSQSVVNQGFSQTFLTDRPVQARTAASIINGNPAPAGARNTFGTAFADHSTIHENWRG